MKRLSSVFRLSVAVFAPLLLTVPSAAFAADTPKPAGPTDPKAIKSFNEAGEWHKRHFDLQAIDNYRTANKQDGGHCIACLERAYSLALQIGAVHQCVDAARDWVAASQTDADRAEAHLRLAIALQRQGVAEKKSKCLTESCDEFKTALTLQPNFAAVHFPYGVSLARLNQDDAARAEFTAFVAQDSSHPDLTERARRYIDRIDLARATMAPAFSVTTMDGQHVSLDSLAGKVVLIDFWATWCAPCRQALPHIQKIAHQFQDQPLVILSVSLDNNEDKWRDFIAKNGMTWLQYRDGSFEGPIARLFAVNAIPSTFTIDADGVLEDQHVGDASIEGKLKKLLARAHQLAQAKAAPPGAPVQQP